MSESEIETGGGRQRLANGTSSVDGAKPFGILLEVHQMLSPEDTSVVRMIVGTLT